MMRLALLLLGLLLRDLIRDLCEQPVSDVLEGLHVEAYLCDGAVYHRQRLKHKVLTFLLHQIKNLRAVLEVVLLMFLLSGFKLLELLICLLDL